MSVDDYLSEIPEELLFRIFSETTPRTLARLAQVRQDYRQIANDNLLWSYMAKKAHLPPSDHNKENIQKLYTDLLQNYPRALIAAVGGLEKFSQLPVLDLGKRMSACNRINFLTLKEVQGHSIWRGKDLWQRPFITFVIERKRKDQEGNQTSHIQTLHQKHRGVPGATGLWVSAGANIIPHEPLNYEFIQKLVAENLQLSFSSRLALSKDIAFIF